ncbi:Hypothetical predicted protein [Podarcis lilfordi]|uniref:Uncharacterized protein n=1 Tax=Podarcis lilfordi TaxID=74358 RepID=A0AA35LDM0_9SAUR|nr:Hypothetical predicted protein [Podarcis lilfordi]
MEGNSQAMACSIMKLLFPSAGMELRFLATPNAVALPGMYPKTPDALRLEDGLVDHGAALPIAQYGVEVPCHPECSGPPSDHPGEGGNEPPPNRAAAERGNKVCQGETGQAIPWTSITPPPVLFQ